MYYPLIFFVLLFSGCNLVDVDIHTSQRAVNQGSDDEASLLRGDDTDQETSDIKAALQ